MQDAGKQQTTTLGASRILLLITTPTWSKTQLWCRFIKCQPDSVRGNLCEALEKHFSNNLILTGLATAMSAQVGRQESPQEHEQLFRAHFSSRKEPELENA